jgi:cytoskeletal protein CcmA (bactofilin family)
MEGAFKIRGLLNAGKLELKLHGPSEAREIGGEKITVKREGLFLCSNCTLYTLFMFDPK